MTTTLKEAKKICRDRGFKLTYARDHHEYRLADETGETGAYYTDDLEDVIGTSRAWAKHKLKSQPEKLGD